MPCYRCGARQTDPVRGPSPWKRGVRRGAQVLICPTCQVDQDWTAELDHCPACGSTRLARALGETTCQDCGRPVPPAPAGPPPAEPPVSPARLAEDVAAAIERVLRRID